MSKKAFTLIELIGVMVILALILLVTVPSITKTLKNKKEEEYQRYLNDIYLATESYVGIRQEKYGELVYSNKAVVELQELIEAGYISSNKINPKTKEQINPLETVTVTKQADGTYSYALSGKENGIHSYAKEGLLLWLDGKEHGSEEYSWNDLSGNGNHGTLKGFQNNSHTLWKNNALYFDGVDDIVTTTEINPPETLTLEMTVKPLFYPTNGSNNNYLLGNWESGGVGIGLKKEHTILFDVYTTEYNTLAPTNVFEINQIIHITATYDGTKMTLWINGLKQDSELAVTGTIGKPSNNTVMAIGGNPGGSELQASAANAEIYSARVYNRALSEEEILKNYEIDKMRFGI